MEFSFGLIGFLIVFPLIVAAALLFVRQEGPRRVIVCVSGVVIALASVVLVVMNLGASCTLFAFESMAIDFICTGISVAIAAVIVWFAVRYKNLWAAVLAGVQVVGTLILEFMFSHGIEVPYGLYFDSLSLLMTFIIGVVGSGICIYALGYMEDFQAHEPEGAPDRRPMFFALMFVFLSAMYVIVFSNNMEWMFAGWEVTTLCSFLLIGYTRTEEAIANAFRQIIMNLAGGLGFLVALWCCALTSWARFSFLRVPRHRPEQSGPDHLGRCTALAFAGITKAAQMPFQTWLLGAMVAPTPTSALLHSSTMVKAGVFLLVKLAPVFHVCAGTGGHGHARGRHHFRAVLVHGHLAVQRQARAGLFHHCQLGPHHGLRRRGHRRGGMGRVLPHPVPCHREVASVPVRRHRRAPYRQPRHRVHGPSVRPHAAPGPLHDARHHVHVHRALRHAAGQVGHARVFRGHPPGRPHHHLGLRQRPPRSCSGPNGSASSPASPASRRTWRSR